MKKQMIDRLRNQYKDTTSGLDFRNPFELLVATILSAQCTDVRVNKITPSLFEQYPTAVDLAEAAQGDVEEIIRSCGFFRVKSENLIATSQLLLQNYGGKVPQTMEELTTLPGVGRKTASVVLSSAFDIPAFPVDTHVSRVAQRLGFTKETTPDKIEKDLKKLIDREEWSDAHHWMIWHGRRLCKARAPLCSECMLQDICPHIKNKNK